MITIVGLGPGSKDDLTLKSIETMKNAQKLYLRTEIHPNVQYIKSLGIKFETFDYLYETESNFDSVYDTIAKKIVALKDVVYAVPGNPMVAEKSVQLIIKYAERDDIKYEILPAVSFIDSVVKAVKIDPVDGLKIIDGLQIDSQKPDTRIHNVVTQVYSRLVASDLKIKLMEWYNDDFEVYLVRAAGVPEMEKVEKMPLYEIDRVDWVDHLTSLYIPPCVKSRRYDFNDLTDVMKRLRSENGCPWDREQTHESLKRYLIEESYEVLDAIDKKDADNLCEELGDVLFQIVFQSEIASEDGDFDVKDVIHSITDKMIKRHTHVFADDYCATSKDVLQNWEKNKMHEKDRKTYTESLTSIPKSLPALMRSLKIQDKAGIVGLDWTNIDGPVEKLKEEIKEFLEVYKTQNNGKILEEMGDIIFTAVNVSRFLCIDPEFALNKSSEKFIKRFEYIENHSKKYNKTIDKLTPDEMNTLWEEAKNLEKTC